MKRRVAVYSFLLGVFISSLSCLRGANAQERALLQGEIVDLPCYMVTGGRGADTRRAHSCVPGRESRLAL